MQLSSPSFSSQSCHVSQSSSTDPLSPSSLAFVLPKSSQSKGSVPASSSVSTASPRLTANSRQKIDNVVEESEQMSTVSQVMVPILAERGEPSSSDGSSSSEERLLPRSYQDPYHPTVVGTRDALTLEQRRLFEPPDDSDDYKDTLV